MTLDDYLTFNRIRDRDFAKLIGMTQSSVNRIARGLQKPSADAIVKIVRATGGKVSADDLLGIVPATTTEEATGHE